MTPVKSPYSGHEKAFWADAFSFLKFNIRLLFTSHLADNTFIHRSLRVWRLSANADVDIFSFLVSCGANGRAPADKRACAVTSRRVTHEI